MQAQQTLCAQMNTIVTNRKSLLTILQVTSPHTMENSNKNERFLSEARQVCFFFCQTSKGSLGHAVSPCMIVVCLLFISLSEG